MKIQVCMTEVELLVENTYLFDINSARFFRVDCSRYVLM